MFLRNVRYVMGMALSSFGKWLLSISVAASRNPDRIALNGMSQKSDDSIRLMQSYLSHQCTVCIL